MQNVNFKTNFAVFQVNFVNFLLQGQTLQHKVLDFSARFVLLQIVISLIFCSVHKVLDF